MGKGKRQKAALDQVETITDHVPDDPGVLRSGEESAAENSSQTKKKQGRIPYSPLILVLLAVFGFVFAFSLVMVLDYRLLERESESESGALEKIAFDSDLLEGDVVVAPSENGETLISDPGPVGTWQTLSPSLVPKDMLPFLQSVNFAALRERNPDTVAWIYWPTSTDVRGLPINVSVVQSDDNDYYLYHSFDGRESENGWVFADYRNDLSRLTASYNTVFYGHARSYAMFGGLKYLNTKTRWAQDGYNHFIYINTPYERTVWQVFSWYETSASDDYIRTEFSSEADYAAFLQQRQAKNKVPAFERLTLEPTDRIITLSTCKGTNEDNRVAVHAVLVKAERIREEAPAVSTVIETDD